MYEDRAGACFRPSINAIRLRGRGEKKKETYGVLFGFGELRGGVDDKDAENSTRIIESDAFSLRGFSCLKADLGIGSFGKELNETPKRRASTTKELMYRKGARPPLTNTAIYGLDEDSRCSEVPGGTPASSWPARDFVPLGRNSFGCYIREDKLGPRIRPPVATNITHRPIKQRIKIFGASYGAEKNCERLEHCHAWAICIGI